MNIGNYILVNTSDYPSQYKDLMDKLALSLNTNIENIYNALNKQITFTDNLSSGIQIITITVDSNGSPTSGASFQIGTNNTQNNNINTTKLSGLLVIKALNQTSSNIYPTTNPLLVLCKMEIL